MRSVRFSATAQDQLVQLLLHGQNRFGKEVATTARTSVYRATDTLLAKFPEAFRRDRHPPLHRYRVNHTPFILLYDYDIQWQKQNT